MLGRLSLIGGIMLTLSASLLGYQSASAADTTTAESRPAVSELQAALQQIESLGDYQTYFGDSSLPLTAAESSHYQEYNYLHRLAVDIRALIAHYDDAAYLEQHGLSSNIFQDVLDEAHDAVRGCSLILGLNRTVKAPTISITPSVTAPAASTNAPTTAPATSTQPTNTSNAKPTTVTTPATTVKAEGTKAPEAPTTSTTDNIITSDAATADPEEIVVPATGETTSERQVPWPTLIAVTVIGAAIASVIIAVVIRQEPRRPAHRRRH